MTRVRWHDRVLVERLAGALAEMDAINNVYAVGGEYDEARSSALELLADLVIAEAHVIRKSARRPQ